MGLNQEFTKEELEAAEDIGRNMPRLDRRHVFLEGIAWARANPRKPISPAVVAETHVTARPGGDAESVTTAPEPPADSYRELRDQGAEFYATAGGQGRDAYYNPNDYNGYVTGFDAAIREIVVPLKAALRDAKHHLENGNEQDAHFAIQAGLKAEEK